jgi:subtilisin family serine protease/PKD repeat protein
MKKHFSLLFSLLFLTFSLNSQTVYEWYQDGIVVFQKKIGSELNIQSKNKSVDYEKIPFLAELKDKYGIYEVHQLHPNDRDILLKNTYQINFSKKEKVDELIRDIAKNTFIEYAEKKELHKHFLTPNDLGANATNTAGTSPTNNQWYLHKIRAQLAWDLSIGSSNIIVAVTDDAIRTTHQDLANKLVPGYDAPTGGTNPNPCGSNNGNHGTHVSGTVGAETNNGIGVSSIGYNVSVMPVKIGNCNGSLTHGYEGINWAANNGAHVINMSWGGGGSSTYGSNVCNAAANAGVILVAAAGNDGTSQQFYPAAYTSVIAVASTTPTDAKSSFSQYGTWISISAPGSNIRSTYATSNTAYSSISGTSMASPNVSGLLGLMKSFAPNATRQQLIDCLLSSATNISAANPNFTNQLGAGRIDAYAALLCLQQYNVALDASISEIIQPSASICGASFTPSVVLRNSGANTLTSATITFSWNGTPQTFQWTGSLTTGQTATVQLPIQSGSAGNYTFTATVSSPNGGTDENPANNSQSTVFTLDPNGQVVNLSIITDCYGEEITWNVRNDAGTIIASGGPYVNNTNGNTNTHSFCLPVGCYTFTISDSYGDGMYGSQWGSCSINGNYFMTDELGSTLFSMTAQNADFGNSTTHTFCVSAPNIFNDAGISQIITPSTFVCDNILTPVVEIRNFGQNTLTSVQIHYQAGGAPLVYNWTGSLVQNAAEMVTLSPLTLPAGAQTFSVFTQLPNGEIDDLASNDAAQTSIIAFTTSQSLPFVETFENNPFTNGNWAIENPDGEFTWELVTVAGTTPGDKAARMNFYQYAQSNRRDAMISPRLNLNGYSSATMTFEHAYRRFDQTTTDSLIIYASSDCGQTYTRVFARGENGTGSFATATTTNVAFNPANSGEWCMGTVGANCFSVDLSPFVGQVIQLKFEGFNSGTVGNNLYIDNINVDGELIQDVPVPNFTAVNSTICEGSTVSFMDQSVANVTAWSWTFPGGTPSTSNEQNPVVTYTASGVYDVTLEVTNQFGSSTLTYDAFIQVNSSPILTISSSNQTICEGNSTSLVASGANSYVWSENLGTSPSVQVSPSITTTYTVTGSNGPNCSAQESITIQVTAAPDVTILSPSTTLCLGGSVTLSANGADSYNWENNLGTSSELTVSPTETSTYTVLGTLGNCSANASITLVIEQAPQINVNTNSVSICQGNSTNLTASGSNSYTWTPTAGLNNPISSSVVASPQVTTTYTVSSTNSCGTASESILVTVNLNPTTPVISQSGNSLSISLGAGETAQWFLNGNAIAGATGSSITITSSGNYTVSVTNANTCSATSSIFPAELDVTSVSEINGQQFIVYPNPATNMLTISGSTVNGVNSYKIIDLTGRIITSKTVLNSEVIMLNVQELASGNYHILLESNTGNVQIPVVVSH